MQMRIGAHAAGKSSGLRCESMGCLTAEMR